MPYNTKAKERITKKRLLWYSLNWGDFIKPYATAPHGPFVWANDVDYSQWFTYRVLGTKKYELTDYLGNVQSVFFDRHTPVDVAGKIDHYEADPHEVLDYYPFGMMMPGRYKMMNGDTAVYRFGFNGQEKTNEIAGLGNWSTAKYWEYCPRTGTRKNSDPVVNPSVSPYAVFDDNPILKNDEDGKTPTAVIGLIVGTIEAGIDMGSQVVGNLGKGMSLKQAFNEVDYADVGLSFAQGFVDGTTLGASKFTGASDALFGAARAGVDWRPGSKNKDERFQMAFGGALLGDRKYNKDLKKVGADLAVEAVGIGLGNTFNKALNIGKQGSALYRQRYIDQTIGRGIFGNMFQVPTDALLDKLQNEKTPTITIEPLQYQGFEYPDTEN